MDIGLSAGSRQMQVLEAWQATVAANLANASTPGYQKTVFSVNGSKAPARGSVGVPESDLAMLPSGTLSASFADGALRTTGNPNDFAVRNGGFFAVNAPSGERYFTKDGEFHLDAEGLLVNKMGYTVEGEGGELTVDLQNGPITVTPDGNVSQNGEDVGKIAAFSFSNADALVRVNGTYFMDPQGRAGETVMEESLILQGHLMGSSVSALSEMVSMIQASRAYEIGQKLIQESDQRLDNAIQTFSV